MIELKDVTVSLSRDGRRNLRASLRLEDGDFAVLLGANGSGKTTIMDVVAGVRAPDRGRVLIQTSKTPVAYAVQDASSGLLPWRTVLANILLPSELQGNSRPNIKPEALRALTMFGLDERMDDYPYKLSGGEKQIVNLTRALCTPAVLLLLDEPLSALSERARLAATELIKNCAQNRTTILITHDPVDLDMPITRYLWIRDGLVAETTRREASEFLQNVVSRPVIA